MRILILGAGGVGGYFGGGRAAGGADVTFLVRARRAAQLTQTGSSCGARSGICGGGGQSRRARRAEFRPRDPLLQVVYLDGAITAIAPAVGPSSLLNGLRHLDALDARFTPRRVLAGGCAAIVSPSPRTARSSI